MTIFWNSLILPRFAKICLAEQYQMIPATRTYSNTTYLPRPIRLLIWVYPKIVGDGCHCEERSDEAISFGQVRRLLRSLRSLAMTDCAASTDGSGI